MIELVPLKIREANEFVVSYHRHNKPTNGGKFSIGLEENGELVGVAIVGVPVARLLARDRFTAEVLRTCVNDAAPRNANSQLYGACWRTWRAMGGRKLITYTLASESGASLRGAGMKVVAEVKGGDWDRKDRKREWQPIFGQQKLRWEVSV